MASVAAFIGGNIYTHWLDVTLMRSVGSLSSSFALHVSNPLDVPHFNVQTGDAIQIIVDDNPVITGYANMITRVLGDNAVNITIKGRDKVADLIDCSATPKQYKDSHLQAIIQDIIAPYGLSLENELREKITIKNYAIDIGQTCHDVLLELARAHGAILRCDSVGTLIIGLEQDNKNDIVITDTDIISAQIMDSEQNHFSQVSALGQTVLWADDSGAGEYTVMSNITRRYRPLIIQAETMAHGLSLRERAEHEIRVRSASGFSCKVTLKADALTFDDVGHTIHVKLPNLGLDQLLLLSALEFKQGATTQILQASFTKVGAFSRFKAEVGLR